MGWLIVVIAISSLSWLLFLFLYLKKSRMIHEKLMVIFLFMINVLLVVLVLIISPEYKTAMLIGLLSAILLISLGVFILKKSEKDIERIITREKEIRENTS